jgi:putative radical SAM enzyme (TIGR03279 family)
MNGQIVLCRDINDGAELDRTIADLTRYIPCMESVSVVPVGLSRYRDGLYPLKPFDKESAEAAIAIIESWQKKIYAEHGIHFIHASDEFYLLAERELPEEERYDGYPQLENGVGMLRLLDTEVDQALADMPEETVEPQTISLATGRLAFPTMQRQIAKITEKYPQIQVHLYAIRNDFFGEMITVSGLVTGQDIRQQLSGCELGSRLLLPSNMFRSGEEVFLDDVTRTDVQNALQVSVNIVKSSGQDLVNAVLFPDFTDTVTYEGYELKEL